MATPFERVRGLAKKYSFKARDQAELESALADAEEGEVTGELPADNGEGGNGETHVHVHMPPNGNTAPPPPPEDQGGEQVVTVSPEEVEELWSANQGEMEAIAQLAQALGGDSAVPRFRDSYPHRDARRKRMGIDAARPGRDETGTADPAGSGASPILREFEMEAPSGAQVVDVRRTADSRYLEESWTETIAKGERIVPGARPTATFDRAAPREQTYDAICGFRRAVLDMAYVKPDGRQIIDTFTRGRFSDNAKTMSCGKVRELFDHVAEVKRHANNNGNGAAHVAIVGDRQPSVAGINSLADMQKQLDEFYAKKS